MAKIKIRNNQTGEITEIDEKDIGKYKIEAPQQQQTQTAPAPAEKSVLQGNLQSENLVSGSGLLSNILNALAKPVVRTGQTIGGGTFEIGRALASAAGNKDVYELDQNGKAKIQNPFLSQEKLEQYDKNPGGALKQQVFDSAALASYGIPLTGSTTLAGAKIAPGLFKGGAVVGAAQSLPEAKSPEDVIKGAVEGGVGAKVLGGALPFLGKGVQNVSNKIGEGMQNQAERNLMRTSASDFMKTVDAKGRTPHDIVRGLYGRFDDYTPVIGEVEEGGFGGKARVLLDDSEAKIQARIKGSNDKFTPEDITRELQVQADKLRDLPGYENVVEEIDKGIAATAKTFSKGATAEQLLRLKRVGEEKFGRAIVEEEKGSPLAVIRKIEANTARDLLKNKYKDIADALDTESDVLTTSPILDKGRAQNLVASRTNFGDVTTYLPFIAANPALGATALGAKVALNSPKVLSKTGNVFSGIGNLRNQVTDKSAGIVKEALAQTGARGPALIADTSQAAPDNLSQDKIKAAVDAANGDTAQTQDTGSFGPAKQDQIQKALAVAMIQDLANGGKNITELKTISEAIKALGPQTKDLTETQQAKVDTANQIQDLVKTFNANPNIKSGLVQGPVQGALGKIGAADDATLQFQINLASLKAGIAKARAGTSFTPNEEVLLNAYTPNANDSPQQIRLKLEALNEHFKQYATPQQQGGF